MKAKYINPYTDFGFKKLFGEEANKDLLIANLDEKELTEYEESLKHYRDLKGVIDTSFEEGEKVGYEKGEKKGYEKGEKVGYEKGEQKGYEKGKMEMAKAMKIKGYPSEEISELTQIPKEDIEKL